MATYGAGYFPQPVQPAAYPAQAWPQPVQVAVNNYAQPTTQVDAYIQQAAPYMPLINGLAPGKAAASAVSEAKGHFYRASASRARSGVRSGRAAANASAAGRSSLMGSVLSAVKWSVIVNGAITVGVNGWKLFTNQQTKGQAAGNVAGDLTSAVVGGAAGGIASAAGAMLLGTFMAPGLFLTLGGMAAGVVGYMVADAWLKNTSLYMNIKNKAQTMFA